MRLLAVLLMCLTAHLAPAAVAAAPRGAGLGLIAGYAFSAPYEDMKLRR
jgi:hypothetical protein